VGVGFFCPHTAFFAFLIKDSPFLETCFLVRLLAAVDSTPIPLDFELFYPSTVLLAQLKVFPSSGLRASDRRGRPVFDRASYLRSWFTSRSGEPQTTIPCRDLLDQRAPRPSGSELQKHQVGGFPDPPIPSLSNLLFKPYKFSRASRNFGPQCPARPHMLFF